MKIVNILEIDSKIRRYYENEKKKRPTYVELVKKIDSVLQKEKEWNLRYSVIRVLIREKKTTQQKIAAIDDFEFYFFDTHKLVTEFENIIKTPVPNSFFREKNGNDDIERQKQSIAEKFFKHVTFYGSQFAHATLKHSQTSLFHSCDSKHTFVDDCSVTCIECSQEKPKLVNNSSFVDSGRVNISSKYTYDRKIHFRDCINQYQGKQNTHIPKDVFTNLEQALVNHRIISQDRTLDRFENVTVSHIHMFLKNLNYTKYYDDAILIHSVITGIQPDNIEHLEEDLMKDFDAMLTEYDKNFKTVDRKNFINTQYVLYQLLKRHKHQCQKEHFVVMRTMSDRKSYHDRVCKTIFAKFGWKFTA